MGVIRPDPDVAAVAALVADGSRATMLEALLAGPPLCAQELARCARISPQTASTHLRQLVEGGLLVVTPRGKRREFRLAGPEVAEVLEALARVARGPPVELGPEESRRHALRQGRTCYDHLAGALGVAVTDAMEARSFLEAEDGGLRPTPSGLRWFRDQGVDVEALRKLQRPLTRACLDWSERRPHLAGALGSALCGLCLSQNLVQRVRGCRAVRVTERGRRFLDAHLGLRVGREPGQPSSLSP